VPVILKRLATDFLVLMPLGRRIGCFLLSREKNHALRMGYGESRLPARIAHRPAGLIDPATQLRPDPNWRQYADTSGAVRAAFPAGADGARVHGFWQSAALPTSGTDRGRRSKRRPPAPVRLDLARPQSGPRNTVAIVSRRISRFVKGPELLPSRALRRPGIQSSAATRRSTQRSAGPRA
jgi:hypothetical protein